MKKLLLFLGITIFVLGLATVALAGGYNPFEEGTKYTTKPHGDGSGSFYNNSTNFCKTCHAVHLAGEPGYKPEALDPLGDTWRLLRATSPEDACDYCHIGAGAHTNKVMYTTENPKGEHTLGATVIPDSNLNNPSGTTGTFADGGGLTCNRCHSVHGADILSDYRSDILRVDPANNGFSTDPNNPTVLSYGGDADATVYWEKYGAGQYTPFLYFNGVYYSSAGNELQLTLFCADCHNLNMNWTDDSSIPDPSKPPEWLKTDPRLNTHTHPMNIDHIMAVNGQNIYVSKTGMTISSCRSCHIAFGWSPWAPAAKSQFPHQSVSHKLLKEDYDTLNPDHPNPADPWYTGDPQRQLPNMDEVCLSCHEGYVGVNF